MLFFLIMCNLILISLVHRKQREKCIKVGKQYSLGSKAHL